MRLKFLILMAPVLTVIWFAFSWAQCPEDTCDRGVCDTFYVEVFTEDSIFDPPYDSVRVALYITHDQLDWIDSIATIVLPFRFSITNPASGCSLPTASDNNWNNTAMNPNDPRMSRSVFRHLVDPVTGDTIHNRMQDLAAQFMGLEWSYIIEFIENNPTDPDSNRFGMVLSAMGYDNRWWWEGSRGLLVTLTFTTYDTTTVCIDSMFWPPSSPLSFWRGDGYKGYIPRHNFPYCFSMTPRVSFCGDTPGDVNLDGKSNVADIVYLLNLLFINGPPPDYCDCADVNCDGQINTADVVYYINYLFVGGPSLQSCVYCY